MTFQKGNNLNPGGKPKQKLFNDCLRNMILQPMPTDKMGLPKKPTALQRVCAKMITEAARGNSAAWNTIMDRIDGKVSQPIQGGDWDAPPIQTQDLSIKEVARRLGSLLLSAQVPEEGVNPTNRKTPK